RRRALASCDGCKGRRVKCQRSESEEACVSCVKAGIVCQTTLPRKTRIYGSVESLSIRYRALDALVKGLFADQDTADTKVLFRIAQERNISMPDANDTSAEQDLFQNTSGPSVKSDYDSDLDLPDIFLPVTQADNPFASRQPKLVDERLIPTPHGVSHYVGPSSSFKFAATIRNMVGQCSMLQQDDHQLRRNTHALRADFANMKISKVIEPREPDDSGNDTASVAGTDVATSTSRTTSPSNTFNDPHMQTMESAFSLLPPRNVADALVAGFFDRVHADFPLFHRSTFQQRYELSWEAASESTQKADLAWMCCLFMVFVLGAQALEEHDVEQSSQLQKRYLALTRARLHKLVTTSSLQNVQALALLMLYEHNSGERNTAWMLVGCAARMAICLGLHRDNTATSFDSIERNIRRRVWWTLYMFEHELSVVLGRPSGIDDAEVYVGLPDETIIEPAGCPDILKSSIQLTQLQIKMRATLYPLPRQQEIVLTAGHTHATSTMLRTLDTWFANMPAHLRPEHKSLLPTHQRAILLLHVRYQYTKTVATRPYILLKANNDINALAGRSPRHYDQENEARVLAETCCACAHETIKCLLMLGAAGLLNGTSWLDTYFAYHAILVICLDFLARPRELPDTPEDAARKQSVVQMCTFIRQTRLASTYHILGQVSVQFARIVGILDHSVPGEEGVGASAGGRDIVAGAPHHLPHGQPQLAAAVPVAGMAAHHVGNMYATPTHETFNTPGAMWDFFDLANPEQAGYGMNLAEFPQAGTFGQGMNPGY
ncbi:hypothetical protein NA57DRAFT_32651, partial [Rhizodiscina lignyota]